MKTLEQRLEERKQIMKENLKKHSCWDETQIEHLISFFEMGLSSGATEQRILDSDIRIQELEQQIKGASND